MIENIPHKKKIALGTIIALGIYLSTQAQGVIKWYKDIEEDIKVIKIIAKDNKKRIEELQKCERNFNADMAVVQNEIENIKEDLEGIE